MRVSLIAISVVLTSFCIASCGVNKGSFLLVNRSAEPIAKALIIISGQTIELKNIQPTKSAPGSYEIHSDSHYDIKIEFQSGKKLYKEAGYVTNGFDFQHEISVTNLDIKVTDIKVKRN